jgi:hypothetical protein
MLDDCTARVEVATRVDQGRDLSGREHRPSGDDIEVNSIGRSGYAAWAAATPSGAPSDHHRCLNINR